MATTSRVSLRHIAILLLLVVGIGIKLARTATREADTLEQAAFDQLAAEQARAAAAEDAAELEAAKTLVKEALEAARDRRWDDYKATLAEGALALGHGVALWEQPRLEAFEIVGVRVERHPIKIVVVQESIQAGQPPSAARTFEYSVITRITQRRAPATQITEARAQIEAPATRWASSLLQKVRLTPALREALGEAPLSVPFRLKRGGTAEVTAFIDDDDIALRAASEAFKGARSTFADDAQRAAWELLADSGEKLMAPWPTTR